ncbi:MAG: hypothetical protein O7A63_07930, partial [Acidobacteria bacterium]|nr:hypothetical protein [Acidobacteriota bacterium]
MRFSPMRRTISSILCAVFFVGAALVVAGYSLAERGRQGRVSHEEFLARTTAEFYRHRPTPLSFASAPERNPFGSYEALTAEGKARGNYFETPFGPLTPQMAASVRRQLPKFAGNRKPTSLGARGELEAGFNAIRLHGPTVAGRGIEPIENELRQMGVTIHGRMFNNALIVEVPEKAVTRLAKADFLQESITWRAPVNMAHWIGRGRYLEKDRATRLTYDLVVNFFAGTDSRQAREGLEQILGPERVTLFSEISGRSFAVSGVTKAELKKIGNLDRIRSVDPKQEFLLMGSETPTTTMVGNVKENLPFQAPYHDVGIDGGGIDTSGDGSRLNNGSDEVPPQIIVVTDNGISVDSVQFSHTATQSIIPVLAPVGPNHRKVHAIQNVTGADFGTGCDSPLDGGGTHGNVVA